MKGKLGTEFWSNFYRIDKDGKYTEANFREAVAGSGIQTVLTSGGTTIDLKKSPSFITPSTLSPLPSTRAT